MDMNALTQAVKSAAMVEGADLVGIAPVSRYDGAPRMLRPQAHLPEAKSVVVMAVHHPDASVEWGGEPNSNYPGPFQIGMIPKLDTICLRVTRFLLRQGFTTVPMPCTYYWRHRPHKDVKFCHAASFSHMNAFVAAGLGEYGWHGMVMSPKYGPRQRIISLVTTAELTPDPLYDGEPLCDRCGQCEKACYGNNYEPEHLFDPKTIKFEIEGKTFEYANINRWRCFWGEQCHLDMNRLAEEKNLTEDGIYDAMDRGVGRLVAYGAAGYMCSSFKYCMAKPVRRWDRSLSPGPKRRKPELGLSSGELMAGIRELARKAGADRLTIQPLSLFESIKANCYEGFRTEAMFDAFNYVITLGKAVTGMPEQDNGFVSKNRPATRSMTVGRLMIGTMDIARFLDDNGCEAMQVWSQAKAAEMAAELAGWTTPENGYLSVQSVICQAPLSEETISLPGPFNGLKAEQLTKEVRQLLPHIDLLGVAPAASFAEGKKLRELVSGARTLIALAAELPERTVELAGKQEAECAMSYQFVNYQSIRETYWAAEDLAAWLSDQGHSAVALIDMVPESVGRRVPYVATFPDLRAQAPFAAAAGLGGIGKHGLLLTPEFGSRQRVAFVLTDAELPATSHEGRQVTCPDGCTLCADACPVQALLTDAGDGSDMFERQDARCEWSRSMAMVEEEGAALSGWRVPACPVPDTLTDEQRQEALSHKDPIQIRCYCNPNHADTTVERCLQACPLGKK